jgi:peptidoglycan/xylan/chitin deacetylase (PgdA/CDA1 family)
MWRTLTLLTASAAVALGLSPVPATAPAPPRSVAAAASAASRITFEPAAFVYYNSRCGNASGRVLLTFDDWAYGDPYRATRIGGYLQSRSIRAAFFLINEYASKYPAIVSTLRQQGHWVLNHTWSHPNLTTLSSSSIAWQIRNGISSNLLRPPYGAYNSTVSTIAASYGYRICTWTIDSRDWQYVNGVRRTASSIRYIIRTSSWSSKASGVVLGHLFTNYPTAVPGIIYDLHQQGLLFCRNRGPVGRSVTFPLACT